MAFLGHIPSSFFGPQTLYPWHIVALRNSRSLQIIRNEIRRTIPKCPSQNIYELRLALAGLPQDMKVLAESETGVSESRVEELFHPDNMAAGFGGNNAT